MKTLGDYSRHCVELTKTLREIAEGRVYLTRLGGIYVLLEADGMIKPIKPNGELQQVELTDKGRELLNRGGYSNFNSDWQPNLFDKY